MCLLVLAWQTHPRSRLVVAANRDEYHERPAAPLAPWPPPGEIIAGRDLRAGGTWLGLDRARRFGVVNSFDPVENIQGGTRYLKYLLDLYNGDYSLALAAYNAGEGAVQKYGAVPPYPETIQYVSLVGRELEKNPVPAPEAPAAASRS